MKFQLVEIAMKEGYDFVSACEMVSDIIKDLQTKVEGLYSYVIKTKSITIKKVGGIMKKNNRCGLERRTFQGFTQVVLERRRGFDRRVSFDPSSSEWVANKTDLPSFNSNRSLDYASKTVK